MCLQHDKKFETVLFMKILFNLQGAFNRFELLNCKKKKHQSFLTLKKKAFLTVQTVPNGLTVFP